MMSATDLAAVTALISDERVLELDPRLASAEVALANVYKERRQWAEAERHYLRALAIDPDDVEAHQQYAESLTNVARFDEALRGARRALALDPTSAIRISVLGYILLHNDRVEEAIERFEQARLLSPEILYSARNLLLTLEANDRLDEAEALALEILDESGEPPPVFFGVETPADVRGTVQAYYAALRAGDFDPRSLELEITETDPGVKGDTSSGGTKPATLETGYVLQVPPFIEEGEVLKIDTRTGAYVERVKE